MFGHEEFVDVVGEGDGGFGVEGLVVFGEEVFDGWEVGVVVVVVVFAAMGEGV